MSPYEELANAIILQAVKDHRNALINLNINPQHVPTLNTVTGVELFFRSEWDKALSSISNKLLIKKPEAEVA